MVVSPTEALLCEIETFLDKTGMAPSAFGYAAAGDPTLVFDLRDGRELRFATSQRIRSFIDSNMAEDRA